MSLLATNSIHCTRQQERVRSAFTLVEMLVATAATLILLGIVMTMFEILGEAVNESRTVGELEAQLRTVSTLLQQDLLGTSVKADSRGLTCPADSSTGNGYFEVIEGPNTDLWDSSGSGFDKSGTTPGPGNSSDDRIVGDTDDLLFFTTQSISQEPFSGNFGINSTTTSADAEVVWFCKPTPNSSNPTLYTLYRRCLLVVGQFPEAPFDSQGSMVLPRTPTARSDFFEDYDLSARCEVSNGIWKMQLNTMQDLLLRRNRFAHYDFDIKNPLKITPSANLAPVDQTNVLPFSKRIGEDILMTNVLSFDVRLLDLYAIERRLGVTRLTPGDKDYWAASLNSGSSPIYVDLGYNSSNTTSTPAISDFSNYGMNNHILQASSNAFPRTWDTWSNSYVTNGIDDDGRPDPPPPNSINPIFIDNSTELPPYSPHLQGIQITIRCYDPSSKKIRQTTVINSFLP